MNKQDLEDNVAEARRNAEESPTMDHLLQLAKSLSLLGNYRANKEGNYPDAIWLYKEVKGIYSSMGDNEGKARACFNLCLVYEIDLHDNELAYSYIKQALEFVQDPRSRKYYEREFQCLRTTGLLEGWIHPDRNDRTKDMSGL
jgi:hypothetical protein